MSKALSGLTANRFGSGGLKFGGAANGVGSSFSWVLVVDEEDGVCGVFEDSEVALMENEVLGIWRLPESGRKSEGCEKFSTPAIGFLAGRVFKLRVKCIFVWVAPCVELEVVVSKFSLGGHRRDR